MKAVIISSKVYCWNMPEKWGISWTTSVKILVVCVPGEIKIGHFPNRSYMLYDILCHWTLQHAKCKWCCAAGT
jgi:hypothetical protein